MFQEQGQAGPGAGQRVPETYGLIGAGSHDEETQILRAFGLARGWNALLLHCLLCFVVGSIFVFVQIVLGAWLAERRVVAALAVPFALVGAVPPLYVFFFSMGPLPCRMCQATDQKSK
ncbi:hypothetical protein EXIGLDRAFT_726899 [Exidia glandulosa HHB12029]|uniref:Uncharacterized protein n=1 Tax=Exidia glandulosa HHB12029 TaxID=1314781 RepID=A0A165ZPK8_EXIGL|nr:hypothetical protein EXIGLDRAFT_726899 [Exidia glandulosa HHB12029]